MDQSLLRKGIAVTYFDTQYKKKIKFSVNIIGVLNDDEMDYDKLVRKLDKRISSYLNYKHGLNDLCLTNMTTIKDINVNSRVKVADYIRVLKRVGRVKGFSLASEKWDDEFSFWLQGNSNGIEFMIYDLEGLLSERLEKSVNNKKQLKEIINKSEGLLRAEVRLAELQAIRFYTDKKSTSKQIIQLISKKEKIFLDIFTQIIPFGNFYKKGKAIELIHERASNKSLIQHMFRLVELIPKKKSLLLAQKALCSRRIKDIMYHFAENEISPVTISKRHDVEMLDNLYRYLE